MQGLNAQMRTELNMLQDALKGKRRIHEMVTAVVEVAARVPQQASSPLVLHLEDRCFKCRSKLGLGQRFAACSCRFFSAVVTFHAYQFSLDRESEGVLRPSCKEHRRKP